MHCTHREARRPRWLTMLVVGLCAVQQAQLISSVVVAGGGACVEGTMERLKLEVETQLAGQSQVKAHSQAGHRGADFRPSREWEHAPFPSEVVLRLM